MTRQRRVSPLVVEWEPGSTTIGDFSWGGFGSEIVAKRGVGETLESACSGVSLAPVEMVEGARSHGEAARRRRGRQDVVTLPYLGPELCELWVEEAIGLDEEASAVRMERQCRTCGFRFYEAKPNGLVLSRPPDTDLFRLTQFPSWIFSTQKVKALLEAKQWSNVGFRSAV
jgi:hypothetical protein